MNPLFVFLILLNAYFLLIFILLKTGLMRRWNMALFGPALMIKTERGRGILDWFAQARGFFNTTTNVGLYATAVIMVLMSLLMVAQLAAIFSIPPEAVPSPRLILGIPGINPIIPIGFGLVALIFAVVVHEFSHGILARVQDLKVKTMGLLLFIVPIGAFVEPDEEEMKAASRRTRLKVFAAGPMSNLAFALIFGVLFTMVLMPGAEPRPGVAVSYVEQGGPAEVAGIRPGDLIIALDGVPIESRQAFARHMANVTPGTPVLASVYAGPETYHVTPESCTQLYRNPDEPEPNATDNARARCQAGGIRDPDNYTMFGIGIIARPEPFQAYDAMINPFDSLPNFFYYIGLPFYALRGEFPLVGAYVHFFDTPFDPGLFWFLANTAFWFFWINLMLGLTNALPIMPLDGGHMFRDYLSAFLHRIRPGQNPERRERFVKRASLWVTFILLGAVILPFIVPRIIGGLA